ncbi:MAG: sugar phosphate isomerase/epimerase family protein [Saprospiraceae bacterium]
MNQINRRKLLKGVGLLTGSTLLPFPVTGKSSFKTKTEEKPFKKKFLYCLNTSTIRGQKLGIEKEIDLAAKAGYDGMEVWIPVLNEYKAGGKSIKDLGKRISDKGLKVFDAIGFAPWIHEDAQIRAKALDQAKAEMEMVRELGCPRIAAPPAGATDKEISSYDAAAERFRTLIEIGVQQGVIPQLELWGFSKTLYKLSQLLYVAAQCGHPQTRLLTDVFHLYKGGSNPDAMKLIAADAIEIFHMNDHLPSSEMATITDADRVFPGDGSAPLKQLLQDLAKNRDRVILSLELFNPQYYKMDAAEVVTTGLAKLKAAVANAAG